MVIIDLDQVSKRYLLHQRRQLLSQHAWKRFRRDVKSFWALRDVSFQLKEGERLGIIGANGAGKTTLLRLISGIAHPTSGAIRVRGRVGAVLGLGTGVHEDLTGRENIHLVASLMGLTRPEVRRRFDSIVEFSGLSTFIDEAVRAYSSGMVSRLGLSVGHCHVNRVEPQRPAWIPFQAAALAVSHTLNASFRNRLNVSLLHK